MDDVGGRGTGRGDQITFVVPLDLPRGVRPQYTPVHWASVAQRSTKWGTQAQVSVHQPPAADACRDCADKNA